MTNLISLNRQLQEAQIACNVCELHGFLSGLICGGVNDQSYLTLLYQFTNDDHAYPTALLTPITALFNQIRQSLESTDFDFQLGLIESDDVFVQIHHFLDWVNQFLFGLGLAQPKLSQEKGDIAEAIGDLQEICQLGYDEDDNEEELNNALEEVSEYTRSLALLFFAHFNQSNPHSTLLH